MQKIKAVIFDLDGTLANTLPLCVAAFKKSIEPLINRIVSEAEIIATFGPSEEGTILALAPDHYYKGVAEYLFFYKALHNMCPTVFNGMLPILHQLKEKNIRLAMVTGKGKYSTEISLQQFGLDDYFEIIETGAPSGPRKPEGIQTVINAFQGVEKNEMIYIGDAPSDILACQKVGIPIIAAAWAETAEPEKLKALNPDEMFYSIPDFANWLDAKI